MAICPLQALLCCDVAPTGLYSIMMQHTVARKAIGPSLESGALTSFRMVSYTSYRTFIREGRSDLIWDGLLHLNYSWKWKLHFHSQNFKIFYYRPLVNTIYQVVCIHHGIIL